MKITFLAAKRCPIFNDMAQGLRRAEGLEVTVCDYASFGPQIFVEGKDVYKAYDVEQNQDSKSERFQSDVETPNFHYQPPSSSEVIRWLFKEARKNGYKMQESDIY